MGQRRTDNGVAKTWRECMGMSQGTGMNGDAGMDNIAHVNKGRVKAPGMKARSRYGVRRSSGR